MSNAWNKTPHFVKDQNGSSSSSVTITTSPTANKKPSLGKRHGQSLTNGKSQPESFASSKNINGVHADPYSRHHGIHNKSTATRSHHSSSSKKASGHPQQQQRRQQQKAPLKARDAPLQSPSVSQVNGNVNSKASEFLQRSTPRSNLRTNTNTAGAPAWNSTSSFTANPSVPASAQIMPVMTNMNAHSQPYRYPHQQAGNVHTTMSQSQSLNNQFQTNVFQPTIGRGAIQMPSPATSNTMNVQVAPMQHQDFPDFPPLSLATMETKTSATSMWGGGHHNSVRSHAMPNTSSPQRNGTAPLSQGQQGQQYHQLPSSNHRMPKNTHPSNSTKHPSSHKNEQARKQQQKSPNKKSTANPPRKRSLQTQSAGTYGTSSQKGKGKTNQRGASTPVGSTRAQKINFHKPTMATSIGKIPHGQHLGNLPFPPPPAALDPHAGAFLHSANMLPMGTTVKGKQKIGKRKKILTSLKKQILRERLKQWRESQGMTEEDGADVTADANGVISKEHSSIVFLKGYIQLDDVEDDDEFQEIQHDLKVLAEKVGPVSSIHIPRNLVDGQAEDSFLAYVRFEGVKDAQAANACWNGMVLGGNQISTGVIRHAMLDAATVRSQCTTDEWTRHVQKISYQQLQSVIDGNATKAANDDSRPLSTVVILSNVLTEDDYEDEDCLGETLQDIRGIAEQHGSLNTENDAIIVDREKKQVLVEYQSISDAMNAVRKMNDFVLGGAKISACLYENDASSFVVCLENILSEDDYDDEECLEATEEDIKMLSSQYGKIEKINIHLDGETKGIVSIYYTSEEAANSAVENINGIVIGGLKVRAWIQASKSQVERSEPVLILQNFMTEDDFDDEDCMEETKCDLREMLSKYGEIKSFDVAIDGIEKGNISVIFDDSNAATKASSELNDSMIGGTKVVAMVRNESDTNAEALKEGGKDSSAEPMYSRDKVIPEQYAECKRAPKIPNNGVPREYAKRISDESVTPLLFDMLGELMRLQIRAKDNKNAKARRRLVMGLREVCRGIRARKVKMIVMANNLDQYGALDAKLEEILDLAKEHDLPVIFELNKRKIGKALGKTIKVSVVGIENADGAYEPFKKLKRLYGYS